MWVDRYVNLSRWNNHNHLGDGLVSGDFSESLDGLVGLVNCHTIAKNSIQMFWYFSSAAATYIGAAATYMEE